MAAKLRAPGWYRAILFIAARHRVLVRAAVLAALGVRRHARLRRRGRPAGRAADRPALLPRRHRLLRLLVPLGARASRPSPTTTPSHGAHSLEGLLPGQHRPQGDRHPVHRAPRSSSCSSAACWRCSMRAELAAAGHASSSTPNTYNGLFSAHASLMIFLFIIPVFAGHRELRPAADDRRAGHGVPAPERAVVLDAADRRRDDAASASSPRAAPSPPAGRPTRRSRPSAPLGQIVLHDRRAVRRRLVDRHRAQLPGHDHHHACARA